MAASRLMSNRSSACSTPRMNRRRADSPDGSTPVVKTATSAVGRKNGDPRMAQVWNRLRFSRGVADAVGIDADDPGVQGHPRRAGRAVLHPARRGGLEQRARLQTLVEVVGVQAERHHLVLPDLRRAVLRPALAAGHGGSSLSVSSRPRTVTGRCQRDATRPPVPPRGHPVAHRGAMCRMPNRLRAPPPRPARAAVRTSAAVPQGIRQRDCAFGAAARRSQALASVPPRTRSRQAGAGQKGVSRNRRAAGWLNAARERGRTHGRHRLAHSSC